MILIIFSLKMFWDVERPKSRVIDAHNNTLIICPRLVQHVERTCSRDSEHQESFQLPDRGTKNAGRSRDGKWIKKKMEQG